MSRWIERCVALGWLAAVGVVVSVVHGDGDAYSNAIARSRGFAEIAFVSLCAALVVTPLRRAFAALGWRVRSASRIRRALGLAAAGGATLHAATAFGTIPGGVQAIWHTPSLRAGLLTLTILLLLGLTSFPALVRRLHLQHWKELHRLAYVALACALWHALSQPFACSWWLLGFGALSVLLGLLRALPSEGDQGAR